VTFLKDKLPKPDSTMVRLIVTLKQSARRCLYRHWEGLVVGREVRTKTIELERITGPPALSARSALRPKPIPDGPGQGVKVHSDELSLVLNLQDSWLTGNHQEVDLAL